VKELRLTPQARADLADIRNYTRRTWGNKQARTYLEHLGRHLDGIASDEVRPRSAGELAPGYLFSRSGSHFIFFTLSDRVCRVVRILHVRSDVARQLEALG
jgi:toxin ParE1/3/4